MTPQQIFANPWLMQLVMLPMRRPDPDAKRKAGTRTERAADGLRKRGLEKNAQTEAKIRAYVRKTPGITASEAAVLLGFSRKYTYKIVSNMIDDGTLRSERAAHGTKLLYLVRET